jgi:hypothetical protein
MRGRLFGVSRRSAAALLALLIVAIAATGASGAKLKTESASGSFGPFEFPSVTAGCGQGTKAVSGGFDTGSFDNFFAPLTSMREGARDWTTDGVNESPDTGTLTTFSGTYSPVTPSGVSQMLQVIAERAGITKRVYPHLLRHSFATEALRRGMNPIQLAQILGHSGLHMIDRVYSHLSATDAHDAILRMFASD